MAISVSTSQRYTREHKCPVCLGYEGMRRRRGERCAGFLSADGLYARCERSSLAGGLPLDMRTAPPTYNHYLGGPCKCGVTHVTGAASPSRDARHTHPASDARRKPSPMPSPMPSQDCGPDRGETRIQGRKPEAVYVYTLADGTPAYKVERWRTVDTATGELGKTFVQKRADATAPGGWRAGLADTPRLPYRLRELTSASPSARVWIVEGEKCADALAGVGMLATCNSGGALHWRECADVARATLAGRDVVILPDNDGERPGKPATSYVGQRHALDVAASLADVAASVRVVMLPGLAPKGDVADWLEMGHDPRELATLADTAPVYDPARPAVWCIASDWRNGAPWTLPAPPAEDAPDGETIREPIETPDAPPDELATRRRSPRRADRGPAGGDTGAPDAASAYTAIPGTPWYLTPDGGPIMELKGRGEGAAFSPVYEWDAPTIRARVKFPTGDSVTGRAVMYDIELDGARELVSYGELHKGEAWERWGALGIAGRTAFANMAATVEYLARRAPVHRGMRYTGWIDYADGETIRHALVLPSGELIGREGVIPATRAYLDVAAHHAAPYVTPDGEPIETPTHATREGQAAALHFITASASRSLATLATLAHTRSIMYGIWRSDCTVVLRGGSGRGKTTVGKWGRNLTGEYGPNTPATAAFTGPTAASIEKHLSQMKSLPVVLDDLVLRDDMTPGERADVGKKIDMVLRSVANNEALRQRQTRNMEDAPAYKVDALPVLTAEELPPEVKASALNRAIVLDIGETDVQVRRFYEDAATLHRAALQTFGRGFIRWLAGEWDTHGASLAAQWMDAHRAYTRQLESDMLAARGGQALPAYADRLPSNGAHLLLAAHALHTYATSAGVACDVTPDSVYSDLLAHLLAQVETIDALATGGNDGEPIGERIGETIREALAHYDAFVTNTDGTDATQHYAFKPEQLGYRASAAGDYQRATRWLGELTPDGEYLTLDRLALHDLLKHTARVQRWRGWRVSARELAATLQRAGLLVTPEAGRHLEHRARRGGRLVRRLVIPRALLWPDYSEPGEGGDGAPIETPEDAPDGWSGGAPEALAASPDALADAAPYSPDTVTYAPDADTYDGRELAGWGDEDADAAPHAPYAPDEDDTDGGALVGGGLADAWPGEGIGETIRERDMRPVVHVEIG